MAILEYVVCDGGHTAGKRMRDYGAFGDPSSPKNALLVECGQHWEKRSAQVAQDVMVRFLDHCGVVDADFVSQKLSDSATPELKIVEVTGPYTITADQPFTWKDFYDGFEVIEKAGTVLGLDGDIEGSTPYDNCVLLMPNRLKGKGHSAVRFGQFVK